MSISLPALRRDAALVVACFLGCAGTFLAIAQATHQPPASLARAVFMPDADHLAPWSAPATVAQPPSPTGVLIIDPANPDAYSVTAIRAGCPAWFTHSLPGQVCLTLYGDDELVSPSLLTGAMLPGGAVIRVRTAGGTTENCTHSTGYGYSTDGVLAVGDGWHCSRATAAPATTAPTATKAPQVATADQIRAMVAGLTRSDLPAGAMISLREASGGIQNCSRGSGPRVNADGVSYSGDGWVCVPATAAPRTEAPYREACFGAPLDSNPQAWDCFLDERIGAGIASRVGTPPTSIQAARP